MIENVHERQVPGDGWVDRVTDLWPADWPKLRLDRPLGIGADGGHGFVRYRCTGYEPGKRLEFTFSPGLGLIGTHVFEAVPGGVRHTLRGRPIGWMRLWWPLAVRWLHDALIEDLFDNISVSAGQRIEPARWSGWVRLLRAAARRLA